MNVDSEVFGPRLKAKQAGALAKSVIDSLNSNSPSASGCDLGKLFSYGFMFCAENKQRFVSGLISTTIKSVAEKKSTENIWRLRVPDWVTLVRETVNQAFKPIVANSFEFPKFWLYWGKFTLSFVYVLRV